MNAQQFNEAQRAQALDLIESLAWGDMEKGICGFEAALALALEAVGDAIDLWEVEGEERFRDEFELSSEQVASLDAEWRLAYIARLLCTAAHLYGVPSDGLPGRNEGELTPPITWTDWNSSPARLLRGLNDIGYGVSPSTRVGS
jgi:hypothetical protein